MNTEVKEIKIMQNTLRLLRIPFVFPTAKEINNPKANLYYKYLLLSGFCTYFAIGAALHMINNGKKGIYLKIDRDISFVISYIGATYFSMRYLQNIKSIVVLYRQFSDFKSYGIPQDFVKRNDFLNLLSKIYLVYHTCGVSTIANVNLLFKTVCEEENTIYNMNEVCGIPAVIWLPFNFNYFPLKQIVYAYQMFAEFTCYQVAGLISYCIMESLEHLVIRFEHVADVFVEALNEKEHLTRRQKFNRAIRYHQAIISMGTLMNTCFSPGMMVHISVTAPVLGVLSYSFFMRVMLDSGTLLVAWMISTCVVCIGGQRLMDASMAVSRIIERIDWYSLEADIKKDLIMVIMRSRRPVFIRAGPFGPITYATMVVILKTAYSYITLLKQTI